MADEAVVVEEVDVVAVDLVVATTGPTTLPVAVEAEVDTVVEDTVVEDMVVEEEDTAAPSRLMVAGLPTVEAVDITRASLRLGMAGGNSLPSSPFHLACPQCQ